jgi:hypothetical protein
VGRVRGASEGCRSLSQQPNATHPRRAWKRSIRFPVKPWLRLESLLWHRGLHHSRNCVCATDLCVRPKFRSSRCSRGWSISKSRILTASSPTSVVKCWHEIEDRDPCRASAKTRRQSAWFATPCLVQSYLYVHHSTNSRQDTFPSQTTHLDVQSMLILLERPPG